LGLGLTGGTRLMLYAVNHGGREAVEVFEVDLSQARPRVAWIGCVIAPQGSWPDSVALLPDGGLVVTSMAEPVDPARTKNKLLKGEPIGWIKEWHPGTAWTDIPGTKAFSAPNGVVAATKIRFIPSYQHIWDPLAARVSKHENGAGVFFTGSLWLFDQPSPDTTIQVLPFVQRSERKHVF